MLRADAACREKYASVRSRGYDCGEMTAGGALSDQGEPDIIEQAPRFGGIPRVPWMPTRKWTPTRKRPPMLAVACVLLAIVGVFVAVRMTSSGPAQQNAAALITEVTTVPFVPPASGGTDSNAIGAGLQSGTSTLVSGALTPVSGPPLTTVGKPEVLYIGAEFCPFCAVENWALIVALSRFGQFTAVTTSRSPRFDDIPPIDSWTFFGASYTSPYLVFIPVETHSNVLGSPTANKEEAASYRKLQLLTPDQQAVFGRYDPERSIPFIDFANQAAQTGSGMLPTLFAGRTWQQIAASLRLPKSALGATLLNEADTLTAELCRLTRDRPAAACQ
jgi:Domain of unknown function (DUF929)